MSPDERVRSLKDLYWNFIDSVSTWLHVVDRPLWRNLAVRKNLRPFEGVPDVYPVAMKLLETIGPGIRNDVGWIQSDWPPRLKAAIKDVARHVRYHVVEQWGWPDGLTDDQLRRLVEKRHSMDMPTYRSLIDKVQRWVDENTPAFTPQELARIEAGNPPFDRTIDRAKKDQFDRIVKLFDDQCNIYDIEWLDPGLAALTREKKVNDYEWYLFESCIDRLDDEERYQRGEQPVSPEQEARLKTIEEELWAYDNTPLIGSIAATLTEAQISRLEEIGIALEEAIEEEFGPEVVADPSAARQEVGAEEIFIPVAPSFSSIQTESIADHLRSEHPRAGIQAALLDYMENRNYATFEEIAFGVHGDRETSPGAIRANITRVNEFLEKNAYRLRFRVGSDRLFKDQSDE